MVSLNFLSVIVVWLQLGRIILIFYEIMHLFIYLFISFLSFIEADVHPNIERESWFRMKHRSRVEREEREEADKKRLRDDIAKAEFRIREIQLLMKKLDNEEDDLEDRDGLQAELDELNAANQARQTKLQDYEKHKKWNVDNMCHVVAEKTVITSKTKSQAFNETTGFALPEDDDDAAVKTATAASTKSKSEKPVEKNTANIPTPTTSAAKKLPTQVAVTPTSSTVSTTTGPKPHDDDTLMSMMSYAQFTEKYEDILETFLSLSSLEQSKDYLIQHGNVLLQENASSYLLLACLEDEMNGKHEKMRLVARQSQIITNIVELAKTMKQHPGNVILPFFQKITSQPEQLSNFHQGVDSFAAKVAARAIVKRKEMEEAANPNTQDDDDEEDAVDLKSIPREQRLGPGGLDPLEVFETLPLSMQEAFESREVERLKEALLQMDPKDAEYHMQRCIDAGLWNEGGGEKNEEE